MNIKAVNITFHVSDFLEAVSFYENILGTAQDVSVRGKALWKVTG
jgi:hypothetical protein